MSELQLGDVLVEQELALDRESLVRYAGASGDFNPIHYWDAVAERVGLPGVLAHGMLTMGLAASVATAQLSEFGEVSDYGVRFTRPVLVDAIEGARVHVSAKVAELSDESIRVDLTVKAAETTVLGKAQLRIRRK